MGETYKKIVEDSVTEHAFHKLEELKISEKVLWQVMDTIPNSIFWKDKNLKYLGCNKSFAKSINLSVKEIVGKDDYEIGWNELGGSYREDDKYVIETGKSKLNYEEQIIQPNGDLIWGRTSKMPLYDDEDNIYGVLGIFEDITERKKYEEALHESQLRYEQLAEKSRSVAWEVDAEGLYTYISPVVKELYGYSPEEIIGKMHFYDFFEETSRESSKESILSKMEKRENISDYENKIKHKNKEDVWVSTNAFPVLNSQGQLSLYRGMDIDITYLKKIEKQIRYLSFRDELTGLYNRRFFEEEIKRLNTERNLPLSLIMIDVNGLKLVNDAFGHESGDLLLKKTADVLRKQCRSDEIIARVGGDEFVILLPNTSSEDTGKIVSRINQAIRKEKIDAINISVSCGYDTKEFPHESMEDVFKKAETKMYKIKIAGNTELRKRIIKNIMAKLFKEKPDEKTHSEEVSHISFNIGKALGLNDLELEKLKNTGILHDIGKIAINIDILNKEEKLNKKDWAEIRRHPEVSYIILNSSMEYASYAEDVLYHHERYDGKGYPKGLKGEKIPLNSRIITLADAYSAMTNDRPYRRAMSQDQALEIIKKESGKQFDPKIVEVFLKSLLDPKE